MHNYLRGGRREQAIVGEQKRRSAVGGERAKWRIRSKRVEVVRNNFEVMELGHHYKSSGK